MIEICKLCNKRWTRDCPRRPEERKGINPTRWYQSCSNFAKKLGNKEIKVIYRRGNKESEK